MDEKPFIVFVLGPPASGKGTLCKRLADKHSQFIFHLSMGDHLRHLINGPLKDQPDIVEMVNSGGTKGLVRGDLVISLLAEKIREEMSKGKSAFLVDGCPRNLEQNTAFKKIMKTEFNLDGPDLVIHVSCPREVARPRYLSRKRGDDREHLFNMRYSDYESRDRQVVELYQDTLCDVNGSMGIEESFKDMIETFSRQPAWKNLVAKEEKKTV